MYCPVCYAEIPDNSYNCPACGVRVQESVSQASPVNHSFAHGTTDPYAGQAEPVEVLSLGDSFMRPFKDPDAPKKLLIMALWGMIPLVGSIIQLGYLVEYSRRVIRRENSWTLPRYDDVGNLLMGGFILFLAELVYSLAIMLIFGVSFVPFIGSITMLGSKLERTSDPSNAIFLIFSVFIVPFTVLFVLLLLYSIVAPLIPIFFARQNSFGDAFRLSDMVKIIMTDLWTYFVIHLCVFGISTVAMTIAVPIMVVPIIGGLIWWFLGPLVFITLGVVTMSAFGEFYYKNREIVNG